MATAPVILKNVEDVKRAINELKNLVDSNNKVEVNKRCEEVKHGLFELLENEHVDERFKSFIFQMLQALEHIASDPSEQNVDFLSNLMEWTENSEELEDMRESWFCLPFFYEGINNVHAAKLLRGCPPGTYLCCETPFLNQVNCVWVNDQKHISFTPIIFNVDESVVARMNGKFEKFPSLEMMFKENAKVFKNPLNREETMEKASESIEHLPFFHPEVKFQEDTVEALQGMPEGTFLVRKFKQPGMYIVACVTSNKGVKNFEIVALPNGVINVEEGGGPTSYESMDAFLANYNNVLVKPLAA